jgi:predicted transglutaminase-like cysteine proteinase
MRYLLLALMALFTSSAFADEQTLYIGVGGNARAPMGWTDFCKENQTECHVATLEARDVVLTRPNHDQ